MPYLGVFGLGFEKTIVICLASTFSEGPGPGHFFKVCLFTHLIYKEN